MRYPAPGCAGLAHRITELLGGDTALSMDWGLDHGTWSVLHHLRPRADCPVIQLSIDRRLAPAAHLDVGGAMAPIRDEGVLIMGSGNITHNLRDAIARYSTGNTATPEPAARFDEAVAQAIQQRDASYPVRALDTDDGCWSHPTADHYLPLLYAFGASNDGDAARFPITGFDLGSLSMRSVMFGGVQVMFSDGVAGALSSFR
jgi:4,5-DOPA dioxygenase extradiol